MKKALLVLMIIYSNWTFGQAQKGLEAVEKFQKELNAEYASPEKSPLLKEDLAVFKSLDFFPYNPNLQIEARFVRTPNEKVFEMKTSTTRKPLYIKFGTNGQIYMVDHELHFGSRKRELTVTADNAGFMNALKDYIS